MAGIPITGGEIKFKRPFIKVSFNRFEYMKYM